MSTDLIKILWLASGDGDNTNAQSLNAREIALRLDPELFASTFFFEDKPDPRLTAAASIKLVPFPEKRRTWTVLKQMLSDYRLITYIDFSPASYVYLHLPRAVRRRTTTVMHVEGPMKFEGLPKRLRLLCQGIIPRCDAYTAISDFVARDMGAHGLRAVATLPVGVDTRRFVPPAVRERKAPTVLFAGAVMERKGVLSVLEVARELPEARFLVLGAARDGFDAVVRKRIEELSISNVQLLGPVSQNRIIQFLQESDIFLLPSRQEGLPKVTLEAAATGLPCVIFNSYQTPSVVHGVTGFQAGSLEEMIGHVKLLVQNPGKRQEMSAAAVRHAKSFDWDVIAPKWQDAYLQMVRKPARLRASAALLC